MKNLKIFLFVLMASTVSFASYAATPDVKPNSNLRTEIANYIDRPSHGVFDENQMVTNLLFMVNNQNEIILVDSGTNNVKLDSYLKAKLNYRRVNTSDVEYYKLYSVKVIFNSK